jgi:fatty-acyl-CoA synthase
LHWTCCSRLYTLDWSAAAVPEEPAVIEFWDKLTHSETLRHEAWEWDGATFRRRTYEQIVHDARHVAAGLRKRGIGPGSVVAAVITNGPNATSGFAGTWFTGATLASLPIIARGMTIPNYAMQLASLCRHLNADCLLAEERFLQFMPPEIDLGVEIVGYQSLLDTQAVVDICPPPLGETIFIQFSSGTTGEPRGVKLSGHAIESQLTSLAHRVGIDPERDIGYSWLPLSHDMGFFGCALLAWYTGMRGVASTPERFLQSPRTWFDDCAEFGATVTAGPPLAVGVAARAERANPSGAQLALRLCLVGAEQIGWQTLADAASTFASRGLGLDTFTPAYGLAEATLAVTLGALDEAPEFIDVDGDALAEGIVHELDQNAPGARRVVSAGTPLPGVQVRIDPGDQQILVQSPSLTSGYFKSPSLTGERLRDGELRTGDVGFMRGEQLYITGRADDLLVIAGRNIFVQDLETMIGAEAGVRAGNCAIVDTPGTARNRVALLAELRSSETDAAELAGRLRRVAREQAGLAIDDLVFVPTGTFPKTPSGKVQRYRCRQIIADPDQGIRISAAAACANGLSARR